MKTKLRPYYFGLCGLLWVVTAVAVGSTWWAVRQVRAADQEIRLEPLRRHDARVTFGLTGHVTQIEMLTSTSVSDQELQNLKYFVHLRNLDLWGALFSDAALANLKDLKKLERLHVMLVSPVGLKLTDEGLSHVRELTSLKSLTYGDARVSDVGLRHLEGLSNLESLSISCTDATDEGLQSLGKLDGLKMLTL